MRFIESILFKDGVYINLPLHQARVDRVFDRFAPGNESHNLYSILPDLKMQEICKLRLVYDTENETFDLDFSEYQARKIETLEILHSKTFDYSLKYENRDHINALVSKSAADDIIISIDDHLTDGSYFNLAFWDGNEWFTPDTPLLKGVRRTQLINEERIKESEIQISDLSSFSKVSLINAMIDLEELELPIDQIKI